MKKIIQIVLVSISIFTMQLGIAQTSSLPSTHFINSAAPHLPVMVRYDNVGTVFYGINHLYKSVENETSIKNWIKNYPEEFTNYKVAMSKYLKDTDYSMLTDSEKETYCDLKSQWLMISQL